MTGLIPLGINNNIDNRKLECNQRCKTTKILAERMLECDHKCKTT